MNKETTVTETKTFVHNQKMSGYIWHIHEKYPKVFTDKEITITETTDAKKQIQEAYLTNEFGTTSVRIINSDGKEHCFINHLNSFEVDKDNYKVGEVEKYPSHIKEIEYLHFKTIDKLTESVSDIEFKTWQPVLQFFVGLTLKNKKNG